jgi:hypothetical protein
MMLNWPTFVLQRRINLPLDEIERVLCAPRLIRGGSELTLGADGTRIRLESPFGVMFPPFGFERASWCGPATVRSSRGRRIVQLEIEINAWDAHSTEVVVRPRARRPYRWSGRRLRTYFRVAHLSADALTHYFREQAARQAATHASAKPARSVV